MPWCMCGGQGTIYGSWFSFTMWLPRIELRSSGMVGHCHPLSHLTPPSMVFKEVVWNFPWGISLWADNVLYRGVTLELINAYCLELDRWMILSIPSLSYVCLYLELVIILIEADLIPLNNRPCPSTTCSYRCT